MSVTVTTPPLKIPRVACPALSVPQKPEEPAKFQAEAAAPDAAATPQTDKAETNSPSSTLSPLMRFIRYGGTELGAVGGIMQICGGIHQWRKAQTLEEKTDGASDIALGVAHFIAASAATGSIGFAAFGLTSWTHAITVSAAFYGASNLVDGGRDIFHGVRHRRYGEVSIGAGKIASAAIMAAGTAIGNVPVMIGGQLVYEGALVVQNGPVIARGIRDMWRRRWPAVKAD